jgi:hypothetical protein
VRQPGLDTEVRWRIAISCQRGLLSAKPFGELSLRGRAGSERLCPERDEAFYQYGGPRIWIRCLRRRSAGSVSIPA